MSGKGEPQKNNTRPEKGKTRRCYGPMQQGGKKPRGALQKKGTNVPFAREKKKKREAGVGKERLQKLLGDRGRASEAGTMGRQQKGGKGKRMNSREGKQPATICIRKKTCGPGQARGPNEPNRGGLHNIWGEKKGNT